MRLALHPAHGVRTERGGSVRAARQPRAEPPAPTTLSAQASARRAQASASLAARSARLSARSARVAPGSASLRQASASLAHGSVPAARRNRVCRARVCKAHAWVRKVHGKHPQARKPCRCLRGACGCVNGMGRCVAGVVEAGLRAGDRDEPVTFWRLRGHPGAGTSPDAGAPAGLWSCPVSARAGGNGAKNDRIDGHGVKRGMDHGFPAMMAKLMQTGREANGADVDTGRPAQDSARQCWSVPVQGL